MLCRGLIHSYESDHLLIQTCIMKALHLTVNRVWTSGADIEEKNVQVFQHVEMNV